MTTNDSGAEREAFEAEWQKRAITSDMGTPVFYKEGVWEFWKAARSQPAPASAPASDVVAMTQDGRCQIVADPASDDRRCICPDCHEHFPLDMHDAVCPECEEGPIETIEEWGEYQAAVTVPESVMPPLPPPYAWNNRDVWSAAHMRDYGRACFDAGRSARGDAADSARLDDLTTSEANHLRRLMGWVRCEVGESPDEMLETVKRIAPAIDVVSERAQKSLVASYRQAENVPKYVRAALKVLTKVAARAASQEAGR